MHGDLQSGARFCTSGKRTCRRRGNPQGPRVGDRSKHEPVASALPTLVGPGNFWVVIPTTVSLTASLALLSFHPTLNPCDYWQDQAPCPPLPPGMTPPGKSRIPTLKDAQDKIFETLASTNHQKDLITPQVDEKIVAFLCCGNPRGYIYIYVCIYILLLSFSAVERVEKIRHSSIGARCSNSGRDLHVFVYILLRFLIFFLRGISQCVHSPLHKTRIRNRLAVGEPIQ